MANLLDQYGIKEVADVTMYQINADGSFTPVLFLDTLKVSTIEQTAEQAEARGGKGNSPLIIWDYGKEITVTLEDALYSPASMAIMFGDAKDGAPTVGDVTSVTKLEKVSSVAASELSESDKYFDAEMKPLESSEGAVYVERTISVTGKQIEVNADTFPGTYRLVGDTYARNRDTGKDEYFQFEIPQAKMSSENTITLEAEGDPSVFNMTMRVLRPKNGAMMKLTQYTI